MYDYILCILCLGHRDPTGAAEEGSGGCGGGSGDRGAGGGCDAEGDPDCTGLRRRKSMSS